MTDNKGKVRAHQLHALRAHAHRLTLWFAGSLLALACSVGLTVWAIALRDPVAALAGAATGFAAGLWSFASWLRLARTRRDIRHGLPPPGPETANGLPLASARRVRAHARPDP